MPNTTKLIPRTFVLPMAGRGQRFADAGYSLPKMLISTRGKTLLEWSISSLPIELASSLVFIGLEEHERRYDLRARITERLGARINTQFVFLPETTRGQAETVLLARHTIPDQSELLIYNIDTAFRSASLVNKLMDQSADGILGSFESNESRFSFARTLGNTDTVIEVREKEVISTNALTGLYFFRKALSFFDLASEAIKNGDTVNGEFYIAPLYNAFINLGKRVVLDRCDNIAILGTPDELESFERLPAWPSLS